MAKRLTMDQLRELRVLNEHEFCRSSYYLSYVQHSRQTMGSFGWHLNVPLKPNPNPSRAFESSYRRWEWYEFNGRTHPHAMRESLEPQLQALGFAWPNEWIKFMGSWMDKAFFEKRMAGLVAQYKEAAAK